MKRVPSAFLLTSMLALGAGEVRAEQAAPAARSLYDRLGGLPAISVVVSDFIDALVPDAQLNRNAAIAAARAKVPAPYLKFQVTALVCQVTGGPCQYPGKNMKEAHAHLHITEAE